MSNVINLDELRKEVDEADALLIQAFEKRMNACRKIGEYKAQNGLEILNRDRETTVIKKAEERTSDEMKPYISRVYETLMEVSRDYQKTIIEGQNK